MDEAVLSIGTKHKVQPGKKISPRTFKLYHQAIENPYNINQFESKVFSHFQPPSTSQREFVEKIKDKFHKSISSSNNETLALKFSSLNPINLNKTTNNIWPDDDENTFKKTNRKPNNSINLNGNTMNSQRKESAFDDIRSNNGGNKSNRGTSSIQNELEQYTRKLAETQIRSVTRGKNISKFHPAPQDVSTRFTTSPDRYDGRPRK